MLCAGQLSYLCYRVFVGVDANKKRRGVVRASLTKLRTKLMDLEGDTTIPTLMESARNLANKLETLRQDFKTHQLTIIGTPFLQKRKGYFKALSL